MPMASEKATSSCAAAKCFRKRQAKLRRDKGRRVRGSYMFRPPPQGVRHERDDRKVQRERRELDPAYAARELVELERDVDRTARRGHPLAPGALAPQAKRLGAAHGGI